MNIEIKRLQNEIQRLRKQNLEKIKQIKYIPLNIISNNLYINNNSHNHNKKQINTYNPFIKKSQNLNNSSLSLNLKKKNKSYNKLPFKQGMFSYKNSLIGSSPNNNYKNNNNYNNNSLNRINIKYNNNSSLLSANLKLNLDNDEADNNNNISQSNIIQGRFPSSSSFDLNKYKISNKTIVNLNLKKPNKSNKNFIRSIISKSPFKIVNSDNNNIQHKKTYNSKINNKLFNNVNNNINNKQIIRNSMDISKISPIFPKKIPIKGQSSPPLLVIDDYKNNNLNSRRNSAKKRKIFDHFRNCEKYEKESRRMIIEYLKVLNRHNYKNNILGKSDINMIMAKKNISKKVLNQEIIAKTFNSFEIFNNSAFIKSNKNSNNELSSVKSSLSNSLINNFNNSVMSINNNILLKNFQSPIKSNINEFLINMNDEKKDKINMVKFLSIPRILHLFFLNKEYKYVCFLCPSNICYINGIESYIFKFLDMKSYKFMGGFDLIKVRLCSLSKKNHNSFHIETFDGKVNRNYEFISNSKDHALYYVKAINYLAQLEKCKIYNNKNILKK